MIGGKSHDLVPAVAPAVSLSLTWVFTILYGLLFFICYVQLWLILLYGHKRFSYQTVFLFLCLIWSGLRTTLFSFYFKNSILANNLAPCFYWLLYCFPVCVQFLTLALFVLFLAQVLFRARPTYGVNNNNKKIVRVLLAAACIVFLVVNIVCAITSQKLQQQQQIKLTATISIVRVSINGSLFIACAVSLAVGLYKLKEMTAASVVLEARGTTFCQTVATCITIVLLYVSRVVVNVIAVCAPLTGLDLWWINVSDQADYKNLDGTDGDKMAYVIFGAILFVWEFLPTFVVVVFFRVQRPQHYIITPLVNGFGGRQDNYIFDQPRRDVNSEDDLSINRSINGSYPDPYVGLLGSGRTRRSYGSLPQVHSDPHRPDRASRHALDSQTDYYDGT